MIGEGQHEDAQERPRGGAPVEHGVGQGELIGVGLRDRGALQLRDGVEVVAPLQEGPVDGAGAEAGEEHHGHPAGGLVVRLFLAEADAAVLGEAQGHQEDEDDDGDELHGGAEGVGHHVHGGGGDLLALLRENGDPGHQGRHDDDADHHQAHFIALT